MGKLPPIRSNRRPTIHPTKAIFLNKLQRLNLLFSNPSAVFFKGSEKIFSAELSV
jgi:hypothetical protein